jgi:hypothetical protein
VGESQTRVPHARTLARLLAREQLVELLVVAHGEQHVAGDDARLLVVAGGVAGELEDLGSEVLEHGREVDVRANASTRRGREGDGGCLSKREKM